MTEQPTNAEQTTTMNHERSLLKSHRIIGWEVARTIDPKGMAVVVLQTSAHKQDLEYAHMVMPVDSQVVASDTLAKLIDAIITARFLGLDDDAIRAIFEQAMTTSVPSH
jgi:hypothetical protein